jgi:hypothetical protein
MSQQEYLLILFNDTGFTFSSRNAYLTAEFKRKITDLDQLNWRERGLTINALKKLREGQKV